MPPSPRRLLPIAAVTLLATPLPPLLAHEDIDRQIATATEKITTSPDDPSLYTKRADLHRVHHDYPPAVADYTKALTLAPSHVPALIGLASVHLKTDKAEDALELAEQAVSLDPQNPETHLARARALILTNQHTAADAAFSKAITLYKTPPTELFIEHASALAPAPKPDYPRASAILAAAIDQKGPIVTLVAPAIDYSLAANDPTAALAHCDQLLATLRNNPRWLAKRAQILTRLDRKTEARQALLDARTAIAKLPLRRRNTQAMLDLLSEITTTLNSPRSGPP